MHDTTANSDTQAAREVAHLGDTVIEALFGVGLHLQHLAPVADSAEEEHLHAAVEELDGLIRTVRETATSLVMPSQRGGASGSPASRPSGERRRDASRESDGVVGDLQDLLEQSRVLRERLHRVTVAIALTDDSIADTFERLAEVDHPRREDYMLTAKRAKESALTCREFAVRLVRLRSVTPE